MKNTIKILMVIALTTAFGAKGMAQIASSTSASASATLLADLKITKNTDIDFGSVITGTTPAMEANSATKTRTGATASLGKFTVTGAATLPVVVSYDSKVTLTNAAGGSLDFNPSVYRTNSSSATYGSASLDNEGVYNVDANGSDYIFVGGTLTKVGGGTIPAIDGTSFFAGTFTGTFNISVIYQ